MYEKFLIQSNRNMHPHCWAKYAQYLHAFAILMCTQNELEMFLCAFHLVCVRSSLSLALYATVNASELAINFTCSFVRSFVETSHVRLDLVWLETWLDLIWLAWTENAANEWLNESQKCKIRKLFNNAGYSSHTSPLFQSALTLSLFLLMCIM